MKDVMGIINNTSEKKYLKEITKERSMASVPFGGRYRMIDFMLSSMVNSGVRNVGILVQSQYRSLMDHVRSGKEWDLARKRDGLFILPPFFENSQLNILKGDMELFSGNLDYLHQSNQNYVIVSGVNYVCNLDFRPIIDYHKKTRADITVIYKEQACSDKNNNCVGLEVDSNLHVIDMEINPKSNNSGKISMEIYIMKKELLIHLIQKCIAHGEYDFTRDCILRNIHKLNVCGYPYEGYVANIDSIESYFKYSMDLLKPEIWQELFFEPGLIHTKVKDEAPAKYMKHSEVKNTLIANGCVIEGKVENSILFRGVKIHKGAHVKNSIVMQNSVIEGNASIENCILDKEARITKGKKLVGLQDYPIVVEKRTAI
ncbi:MAG: glucose-1-phosphate adenylyltransferase subunit GlgD [Bacillota bacterium]